MFAEVRSIFGAVWVTIPLSLSDLSSYHSHGYGRNGLVWALAGCWDMKLGLGRPVDPPPPAQWSRENDSKEGEKRHKMCSLLNTSCSDANHTVALFFFSFLCRPCGNCRYLQWAGEAVVFLLFSLSLSPVLSVSQPLPGLHCFSVHRQHSAEAPGFKYWVATYHVAKRGAGPGWTTPGSIVLQNGGGLDMRPHPLLLYLPPLIHKQTASFNSWL